MSRTATPAAGGQPVPQSITRDDELLSPDELAAFLKKSPDTLQRWREQRRGPTFIDVEGTIYYRRSVVDAYLASRQCNNTAQPQELRKGVR